MIALEWNRLAPGMQRVTRTPNPLRRFARVLWLIVLAIPLALLLAPWRQNVRGDGRVIAYAPLERQQTVEAPIDGRIIEWWVAEGSTVQEGDPLFEITDNDPMLLDRLDAQLQTQIASEEAANAKVASYQEQMDAIEVARGHALDAARERVSMAEQKILESELALDAAQISYETAQLQLTRQEALAADGLASTRELELARLDSRRTTAERDRRQAALRAAGSDRAAKQAEVLEIDADFDARIGSARANRESAVSDAAKARESILSLETRMARQRTQRVLAPMNGTVLRLVANQGGEIVKAADPVVVLVPDTQNMAVELLVDGNDMPLLSVGRRVRLQFEGWPAVQFAGWPSVARGTFGGIVRLIDATDDGAARFRVVIVPDPEDENWPSKRFLRQGVQARGWILLEEVSLGFELWRNLNGFPPVIADAEPKGGAGKTK